MRRSLFSLLGVLFISVQLLAQNRTITGKVTDAKSNPVVSASVLVKGTSIGSVTKEDGTFSLNVPANARVLVISAVGMATQEVNIANKTTVDVVLQNSDETMQEILVVGYGTVKKSQFSGSVSTVGPKQIENVPMSSVDKILQGKVAGLRSVSGTGAPGSNQTIILRGLGSITASTAPLFVVDGVPINSGELARISPTSNALAGLNPNDIESVSVLKDASATSIYGSRAANGVILITTKSGRAGKTRVRFDTETGFSELAFMNEDARPLNTAQYKELTAEGIVNLTGWSQAQAESYVDANFGTALGVNTDWLDVVTQRGNNSRYNLAVDGGNTQTQFRLSGELYNEEGTIIKSKFKRYGVNLSASHKINDKMKLSFRLPASFSSQSNPNNGGFFRNPVLSSFFLLPTQKPYNDDGTVNVSRSGFPNFPSLYNPVAIAELSSRDTRTLQLRPNVEYLFNNIVDGLNFTSRYGVDFNNLEENQYDSKIHGDARNVGGRAYAYQTRYFNWVFTNLLNYKRSWGQSKDISSDVMLGYEAQKSQGYFVSTYGEGFPPTEELRYPSVAANPKLASADRTDYAFSSILSQLRVGYKDKYILDGSLRRDGSSRFGPINRFGTFWSVGATYNIDRESFMNNIDWMNTTRLRVSYGVNGNGGIGNYTWITTYAFGSNYNGNNGSAPGNTGDSSLTWEINKPFNVGIDLGFFKNRLNLTVDYYIRKTTSLLLDANLPLSTGVRFVRTNIGSMENKGIEISLQGTPVRVKDFSWDINFNFAYNKNKITGLYEGRDLPSGAFLLRKGYDAQTFYVRQWAGVDPANGDPLWYKDVNKSGTTNVYSQAAQVLYGSATPKYFGGFTNTFTYKGFYIQGQLNYNFGNLLRDTWARYYMGDGFGGGFNKMRAELRRWRKPGDVTDIPKYVFNGNKLSSEFSSRFLYKGDYIRLRDLQVGYNFPKDIVSKIHASSLNFYVRGTNLWTWVKDKNLKFDPEQGGTSQTNLDIFIPRTLSVGLSVIF